MNKSYRTVWNAALGAWVATSEITKARGKSNGSTMVAVALASIIFASFSPGASAQSLGSGSTSGAGMAISSSLADCVASTPSGDPAVTSVATVNPYGPNGQSDGIALGCGSQVTGIRSIAIGWRASATMGLASSGSSIAIGTDAVANNATGDQIAIGRQSSATGVDSIAIGGQSRASATNSININTGVAAGGVGAGATNSIAIGSNAIVSTLTPNAVALGASAVVSVANSVALGANSLAAPAVATKSTVINGVTYSYAGDAPSGVVAVGGGLFNPPTRQIQYVAAGQVNAASTDAVNGSQLYATNQAIQTLGDNAVQYDAADKAKVTLNPGGGTATTVTNVAAGALNSTSTDAVNGSQLFATNTNVTNLGTTVNNLGTTVNNLGTTVTNLDTRVTNINDKGTKYFHANSTGADSQANGLDSVAIGQNAVANGNGNIALGANSLATGSTLGNAPFTPVAGAPIAGTAPVGEVSVGSAGAERRITNVAAGSGATDAVNVSQLQAVTATATANAVQYDDATRTKVTLNPGGGTATTVTNVAAGALNSTSTDAVNGSQLFATNTNVANLGTTVNNLGTTVTNLDTRVTNINDKGTKYFHANSTGTDSQANGLDSVAIGQNAVANGNGNIALGANSLATGATLGNAPFTPVAGAPIAGTAPVGEVSVGSAGAERRITNVAAGSGATDAVNVSQLQAVTATATANAVQYDDATRTKVTLNPGGGTATTVTNVAAGALNSTSTDAVNGSQLFATNTNVTNLGTTVNNLGTTVNNLGTTVTNLDTRVTNINDKGTKYFHANSTGTDSQANGLDSVAIGQNAVANGTGNIALGANSLATGATLGNAAYLVGGTASGEVNVGNRRVTGVAAGAETTDAVNVGQLSRLHDESIRYDLNPNGSINFSSITLGNGAGPSIIHNVANGVALTDAVNVSQLNAATGSSSNKWVVGNPTTYTAPSAAGVNSTAVGSGASSTGSNSVALGNNASDAGRANVLSVGATGAERQVTNVAAGTQSTDAVNVSQLRPLADAFGGGTQVNADGTITGPTYNISTVNAGGSTSTNTYNNVGDALGGLSNSVVNLNNAVTSVSNGGGIKYFHANSATADSVASGAESTAMGPQAIASGNGSTAAGDRSQASGAGSVAVGQQSVASGESSVAVGQGAQATNTGSLAIGLNSSSTGVNTIAIGTGAVATNSVAVGAGAQAGGGGAAFGDNAIAINTSKGTALGNSATVSSAGGVALGADSVADRAGMNGQREALSNVAVSSTQGAVSVGSAGNERQITNVAGGTQATDAVNVRQLQAAQAGSVRYDTNADGSVNYNNVTLGNAQAPNGTTVSNVAPGVAGTDAVNVNQLNAGVASANQYTDSKVGQIQANVDKVSKDASAGTAGAMAMANLPQATIPGKGMVSAGVASFAGQAAMAIGVSKLSDNGRWIVKFSGTANSRGQVGVAGGVGFHW